MKSQAEIKRAIYVLRSAVVDADTESDRLLVNSIQALRWVMDEENTALERFLTAAEAVLASYKKKVH